MIGVLGINHKTAPIDIRERFTIDKSQIVGFAEFIHEKTNIQDLVSLSTCNRSELYYYVKNTTIEEATLTLIQLWHQYKKINKDFKDKFYAYRNKEAIKHLFSVTSGLDSMIFGEDQIVNQVKDAYLHCTDHGLTDAVLMRLFQKSFETGKRVRSETDIQQGATSISYAAVDKCNKVLGSLTGKRVLFIGVGETGRLVLQKMKKQGENHYAFANRTYSKSVKLAEENNGKAIPYNEFGSHLHEFDIVITATNAGEVLISMEDVKKSVSLRKDGKQIYIDLSVPRNIHHGVKANKQVNLITIDDLEDIINKNAARRMNSRNDALVIIDEMVKEFDNWYRNRSLRPVIKAITENMQNIHNEEFNGYSNSYNPDTLNAVEQYASRLTQKYIRSIIKNLREINEKGETIESLDAIKELFIFDNKK